MKGKSGTRKYGRCIRKPSHIRYNLENRREINKARKIAKQKRIETKKGAKQDVRQAGQET